MATDPREDDTLGPSQSELIEMMNEERESGEPCETCERSHDPNQPCGTRFGEP
jgi:hypothetical protein